MIRLLLRNYSQGIACGLPGILACALIPFVPAAGQAATGQERPNILVFMADDWGFPSSPLYGDKAVQTPGLEQIARDGVLFSRGYCPSPSCTPSRAALLTGQDIFRLEENASLRGPLQAKFATYPDLLEAAGYAVGYKTKGWGPGEFQDGGRTRNPAGPEKPDFEAFLREISPSQPFCYWFGSTDPHRPYRKGTGIEAGINPADVIVPGFLPDTPEIRSDLCDYLFEVQRFNEDVAQALALLERTGRLENTLIIITGDNGMPFPRCKMNLYEWGVHVPLAISWKAGIPAGRTIDDFVSFIDLAPTILEAAGLPVPADMTGRSLLGMLSSTNSGRIEADRDAVVTARERHGASRFPMRSIRTDSFSYIRNHSPDLPAPHSDDGPTRQFIESNRNHPDFARFHQLCFGDRPAEELYDVSNDPYELNNLADNPRYREIKNELAARLTRTLVERKDPRALGKGEVFDNHVIQPSRRPSAPAN